MSPNIVNCLVNVSEKAANIARIMRQHEYLFSLLVQEKSIDESNSERFVHDYKTLADVLIQQTIRHDIGIVFPELLNNIRGEESSTFTNSLGETVNIEVFDNQSDTSACLLKVLNGDSVAAELLAEEVHKTVNTNMDGIDLASIPELPEGLNYSNMGIWVDPIDATEEYIRGSTINSCPNPESRIPTSGLGCVTVLIGGYDIESGKPIIGVINQPFAELTDTGYKGKIIWGVNMDAVRVTNLPQTNPKSTKLAVLSSSEDEKYIKALKDLGYGIVFSAGAGHKILKVITGDADLYLLSKNTTFKWDTCGPQAILNAIEGGLFKIEEIIESGQIIEVDYDDERPNLNEGGLLALRREEKHILQDLYNKK